MPAWLAEEGATPSQIAAFVAISSLPWGFKLVAGPVMDRFSFLPMGRRRPWVVIAQCGLVLSLIVLGFVPDPVNNMLLLTAGAFVVNSFAALQDVAVDGMAIDVLPVEERGRANAFMGFGQVAGYAGSAALVALLLVELGLPAATLALAIGAGLILSLVIRVREREGERILPWTAGEASARSIALRSPDWHSIFANLMRVMFLPASIILLLTTLCWRMTSGFWDSAAPVIVVQQLGFASTDYSYWNSITSGAAAVLGLLLGPVIDRTGARLVLMAGIGTMGVLFLVTGLLPGQWNHAWFPVVVLVLYALCGQAIFISFIAMHMNICWLRISATQFAIYMAWANLSRSIGAAVYAEIEPILTSPEVFIVMAISCFAGAALLTMLRLDRHEEQLKALDK